MVLALSVLMVVVLIAPGGASSHRIVVSGDSVPSDCNKGRGAGAIKLSGDLEGCLTFFPERFTCNELNGFARYKEWGRELFIGKLNGELGLFRTTYKLVATYAQGSCDAIRNGDFPFENQLTGGCDHRVTGKKGAFEGVEGLITFFDYVPAPDLDGNGSGATNFFYSGWLSS